MRRRALGWMLPAVVALWAACDGDSGVGSEERVNEPEASVSQRSVVGAVGASQGASSRFDRARLESVAREWQGSWVVPRYDEGDKPYALEVSGGDVSVFWSNRGDAGEETGEFRVISPCTARVVRDGTFDGDGGTDATSSRVTHVLFTFSGDRRHATAGLPADARDPAGFVTDEGFTVCVGPSQVVVLDESGCESWSYGSGDEPPETIKCSLSEQSAEIELSSGAYLTVERRGDVLLGEDIASKRLRSFPSFEAAKSEIE